MDATGLFFMKTKIHYPKLTTAPAMLFGKDATQNSIALTAAQLEKYLNKEDFEMMPEQSENCTDMGYVLVSYQGYSLGTALYFVANEAGTAWVRSLFPKYLQGP